ncbi:immunoglobulin-binding protein 1 isoform X1 [Centruroides vittatus]|uniref:immunoglobulin-binding protein 1 isoform X1 n=2 Tax=Centruroides vittatus TaxID=120091 RepID=UPI0035103BCF
MDVGEESIRLSEAFDKAFSFISHLESSRDPTGSKQYQNSLNEIKNLLEEATHMVNQIGIFSKNEDIEEIPTADIKYLLLPALLGSVVTKYTCANRNEILDISEIYFKDFLKRCKEYGITDVIIPDSSEFSNDLSNNDIEYALLKRQEKIARYKLQKEMEKKIDNLRVSMEQLNVDEEIKREYYLLLIKKWIDTSLEELTSIYNEKLILKQMPLLKDQKSKVTEEVSKKPLKPVIITRNELQKKVFGLGYPSIPIMTVDEFYDQKYGEGGQNMPSSKNSLQQMAENPELAQTEKEKEEEEEERKLDHDDSNALKKAREWDDWKDDHRRGCGNRKNMG